jgi:hypothetical protein
MMNNYLKILLLAGLFCLPVSMANAQQKPPRAQKQAYWDVIYLKNGSVIKGNIIDSSATAIKLENRIQDTLVYSAQEIAGTGRVPKPLKVSRQGFYGMMEAGIQLGDSQGAVLRAIAGYRLGWQLQTGIGIGLDDYSIRSAPVFGDIRYDFSRKDRTLFAYGGAGVSIPWPTRKQLPLWYAPIKKDPGLYLHTGLGYKIRMEHSHSVHISAGYAHTEMSLKYPAGNETYSTFNYSYNRVTILLGYTF